MILHNKEPLGPYSWEKVKEEKWTDPVSNPFPLRVSPWQVNLSGIRQSKITKWPVFAGLGVKGLISIDATLFIIIYILLL